MAIFNAIKILPSALLDGLTVKKLKNKKNSVANFIHPNVLALEQSPQVSIHLFQQSKYAVKC